MGYLYWKLDITKKILSGSKSLTSDIIEEWMQKLWEWADENNIASYTKIRYSLYELLHELRLNIIYKFQKEYKIDLLKDEMSCIRILDGLETNIKSILEVCEFKIDIPFISFDSYNSPIHLDLILDKSMIQEAQYKTSMNKNIFLGIPRNKNELLNLNQLNLEVQGIKEFPEVLFNLTKITVLNIQGNSLSSAGGIESYNILKGIEKFDLLEELSIANSSVTEFSNDLGKLKKLNKLVLKDNRFLQKLPNNITHLTNLKVLDLRNSKQLELNQEQTSWINKLKENGCIVYIDQFNEASLVPLVEIDDALMGGVNELFPHNTSSVVVQEDNWMERLWQWADDNNISDLTRREFESWYDDGQMEGFWQGFPRNKGALLSLKELNLPDNALEYIPREIKNLSKLEVFGLWDNSLKTLPKEIGKLINLKELILSRNKIKTLPNEVTNLPNLYSLKLDENSLSNIPEEIYSMTCLKTLSLMFNNLKELPNLSENLLNLENLLLNGNRFSTFPIEVCNIKSLTVLDMSFNQLITIPSEIGNLCKLTRLGLNHNDLITLPEEIINLVNLTDLNLSHNKKLALSDKQKKWISQLENNGCIVFLDKEMK